MLRYRSLHNPALSVRSQRSIRAPTEEEILRHRVHAIYGFSLASLVVVLVHLAISMATILTVYLLIRSLNIDFQKVARTITKIETIVDEIDTQALGTLQSLWAPDGATGSLSSLKAFGQAFSLWMDRRGTMVCETPVKGAGCLPGTLVINDTLSEQIQKRLELVRSRPLGQTTLIGSHRSYNSVSDGLEAPFQLMTRMISFFDPDFRLKLTNQILSIPDQLRLGVRALDFDIGVVGDDYRVCYSQAFDTSKLASILTRLSPNARREMSDPLFLCTSRDQTLTAYLQQVRSWLDEHPEEFIVLSLHDQTPVMDVQLLDYHLQQIYGSMLWKRSEYAKMAELSIQRLVQQGKRVFVLTDSPTVSSAMLPVVLSRRYVNEEAGDMEGRVSCLIEDTRIIGPLYDGAEVYGRITPYQVRLAERVDPPWIVFQDDLTPDVMARQFVESN